MQTTKRKEEQQIVLRLAVAVFLAFAGGCGTEPETAETAAPEPEEKAEAAPAPPPKTPTPEPFQPEPPPIRVQEEAEASYMQDTHWVPGKEGKLILGLDGGEYSPYKASVVRDFQRFLFDQELYNGPVTGVLDLETMKPVGRFQEAHGISESGVPSPATRRARDRIQSDDSSASQT